jgi:hypothetical protein
LWGGHYGDQDCAWLRGQRRGSRYRPAHAGALQFDSLEDWVRLYTDAGVADVQVETGPFNMMTPAGFLHDEGLLNSAAVMGRAVSRLNYMRRMAWLMPRVARAVPYLGFILVSGTKPPAGAEPQA